MTLNRGYTDELKATTAIVPLGVAAEELLNSQMAKVGQQVDAPVRMRASATPDALLNFSASYVTDGDGGQRATPPIDDLVPSIAATTLNYQTAAQTGATIKVDGAAFAFPSTTIGQFRRHAFVLKSDGSIDSTFSAAAASVGALTNAGTLFAALDGLAIGFIDLEATASTAFKTAGSATAIIENSVSSTARIFRFGAGSGSGSGSVKDFKISSISTPSATIKGGYIELDDGRELATYDGSGSSSTDYGKDLIINLTTVFGSAPVNNTAYALYIDLDTLGAEVTLGDNGRKVYAVIEANFKLFTTMPAAINRSRYVPIGLIHSATTGTVWSGSGASFATFSVRRHANSPLAILPTVYTLAKQAIGSVGSVGQVTQGHVLTSKSFPAALSTANFSYYTFASTPNDGGANGKNLTNVGTPLYTGLNLFGVAGAATLDGSTNAFVLTDSFFDLGSGGYAFGGWYAATDWTPASAQFLMHLGADADPNRQGNVLLQTDGTIRFREYSAGTGATSFDLVTPVPGFVDGTYHHIMVSLNRTDNTLRIWLDGKLVSTAGLTKTVSTTSGALTVGQSTAGGSRFAGRISNFVFVKTTNLTDEDVRKLASYRLDHNADVAIGRQRWSVNFYGSALNDEDQTATGWMVDKYDASSLFLDFSDRASTDQVELFLENRALSALVVSSVPPFDTIYTSNPSFPIAHGQVGIPILEAQGELTSGVWEPISLTGQVNVDSTNLVSGSTLQPFFSGGYLRVRVIARSPLPTGAAVGSATKVAKGLTLLPWGGATIIVGSTGNYTTMTAALAAAVAGDCIRIVSDTAEVATLTIPAGVRVEQMPNTTVVITGTFGVVFSGARGVWKDMNVQLNPAGTLAIGISVTAADCWVEGWVELNTAQTVTDMVNIGSGGSRVSVELGIKKTLGTVTNAETNADGASRTQIWGV